MALNMAAIDYQCDQCQEFAMPHQLVRAVVSEVSIPNLLTVYLPLSDCTCGRQRQRSPSCVPRHVNAESRDLSMSQVLSSKHIALHRVQILRDEKAALHGDKESLQIYLSE